MAVALIVAVNLIVLMACWIVWREMLIRAIRNQYSKLLKEITEDKKRYDDLVQSIKVKAEGKPGSVRRKARNFSEFRDAAEKGVLPRGMKEKPNA